MNLVHPPTVLVGLGNPGPKYHQTRHNFGFLLLDRLADLWAERSEAVLEDSASSTARRQRWRLATAGNETTCDLVWPTTYMNLSGRALEQLYLDAPKAVPIGELPSRLLVIIDDLSLPLGQVRWREKGSSGGHNGLKSIEATLTTPEYPRLRLGVGHPGPNSDIVDYVLAPFSEAERPLLEAVLAEASHRLDGLIRGETTRPATISALNGWRPAPEL